MDSAILAIAEQACNPAGSILKVRHCGRLRIGAVMGTSMP